MLCRRCMSASTIVWVVKKGEKRAPQPTYNLGTTVQQHTAAHVMVMLSKRRPFEPGYMVMPSTGEPRCAWNGTPALRCTCTCTTAI